LRWSWGNKHRLECRARGWRTVQRSGRGVRLV
jgi:hypothetical protein